MDVKGLYVLGTLILSLISFPRLSYATPVTMDEKVTAYTLSSSIGNSASGVISGLPIFDERLGTFTSASVHSEGTFSLPAPIFNIGFEPAPGPLGTETFQFTVSLENYLSQGATTTIETNESAYCPPSITGKCLSGSFPFASNTSSFSFSSNTNALTGSNTIPISTNNFFVGSGSFSGNYSFSGQISTSRVYEPFSVSEYISAAIAGASGTNSIQLAQSSIDYVHLLRASDGGTSSTNLNLRDAEYAFLGYKSGVEFANFTNLVDAFIAGSPISWVGYNAAKECALNSSICGKVWTAITGQPPGQTTDFPPSPVGGGLENANGFIYGLANPNDMSGLANVIRNNIPNIPSNTSAPLTPNKTINLDPTIGLNLNLFFVSPAAGDVLFLDPVNSKDYTFSVNDNSFSDFELPFVDGKQNILNAVLHVKGISKSIVGGQWYNFSELFGISPYGFTVSDMSGLVGDNPIFAIKLTNSGFSIIGELSSPTSPVPEPDNYAMLLAGLSLMGFVARKRKNLTEA